MPQVQLCPKEIIATFTFFHDFAGRLVGMLIRARRVFSFHEVNGYSVWVRFRTHAFIQLATTII